ncbi:MAG TPA: hypothetical protein VFZ61_26470 [Polyangiales bacterium]
MSTPDADPGLPDSAPRSRLVWLLRGLAAIAAFASLASLWFSERARVRDDLQLSAEAAARPGETLALRAFYLRDVEAPAGPSLATPTTRVRLLDTRDRVLAETQLRVAKGDLSLEGSLRLPTSVSGGLVLEARAQLHDRTPLTCRRGLLVSPSAPTLAPHAREAAPLQQQALGALRERSPTDLVLLPRVLGGACVPEQRCTLLVWVGGQGASVTLRHDAAVRLEKLEPVALQAGFVEIVLTVHGPEASVVFEARRGEELLAERTLRLPVALGEAQIDAPRSLLAAGEATTLALQLPPGRTGGILDLFVAGRWRSTQGFGAPSQKAALPLRAEAAGLLRVQAHTDRFTGEGAAARALYVREVGEDPRMALARIAAEVQAAGFEATPWDASRVPPPGAWDPQRAAAFMLAALEGTRLPLPRAVSARPLELRRLSKAQTGLRFAVSALLLVCALGVGMTLARRGLGAQTEAMAILAEAMAEADESEAPDAGKVDLRRNRGASRGVYFVLCLALAVGLAFVLAALLIVAKPLWF